jgi:uncharacterized caspase-like protein
MKRAVIIGVDEYRDDHIHDLHGPRNDATELEEVLSASGDFEVADLLIGPEATSEAVRRAVSDLLWRTDKTDLALLYFSGHAYDDAYGNGYLAPYDMDYERPWVHGVRMQEINDLMLKAINKEVVLLVLDACKSGIAAKGERGAEPARPIKEAFVELETTEPKGTGRIVLASSGADESSYELCGEHQYRAGDAHTHGAFTFQLLEGLSGSAASDGENVSLDDLTGFVERELKGQTFTFFGSGLQHSKQIGLVRAAEFANITARLNEVRDHLDEEEPTAVFVAISKLSSIKAQTANNLAAAALRRRIDERLAAERDAVVNYLTLKRVDLITNSPKTCGRIDALLPGISFETFVAPDREEYLLGLIISLWMASYERENEDRYGTWLNEMRIAEKSQAVPARAKPEQQGAGAGARA